MCDTFITKITGLKKNFPKTFKNNKPRKVEIRQRKAGTNSRKELFQNKKETKIGILRKNKKANEYQRFEAGK